MTQVLVWVTAPPYGKTSHIPGIPTLRGLLTNNPGDPDVGILEPDVSPGSVKPGSLSTIGDTEQGKGSNSVSPNMVHINTSERGQGGVILELHTSLNGKRRAKENIGGIFKLFAHLLRDGPRSMDCYLIIHQLTLNDLNNLLESCELASWRACKQTEGSF